MKKTMESKKGLVVRNTMTHNELFYFAGFLVIKLVDIIKKNLET